MDTSVKPRHDAVDDRRPPSSPDLIGGSQGLIPPKALLRSLGKTGRACYISSMTAEDIAGYIRNPSLFWTDLIQKRFAQRNIPPDDVETALANCEIIEQYPEDYPFPSGLEEERMTCFVCKGTVKERLAAFTVDMGKYTIGIRKVPAFICEQCGDTSCRAETMERLDEIVSSLADSAHTEIVSVDYSERGA